MRLPNYSGLFTLFSHDKPDKTGIRLEKIGTISFAIGSIAAVVGQVFGHTNGEDSLPYNIALGLFASGFSVGLFMFIATGIHYSGRNKGRTFIVSAGHTLKNVFLFIFLPAIIVTALLITWAVVTEQPAFR